jgi:hypothetical protein
MGADASTDPLRVVLTTMPCVPLFPNFFLQNLGSPQQAKQLSHSGVVQGIPNVIPRTRVSSDFASPRLIRATAVNIADDHIHFRLYTVVGARMGSRRRLCLHLCAHLPDDFGVLGKGDHTFFYRCSTLTVEIGFQLHRALSRRSCRQYLQQDPSAILCLGT